MECGGVQLGRGAGRSWEAKGARRVSPVAFLSALLVGPLSSPPGWRFAFPSWMNVCLSASPMDDKQTRQ